LLRTPDNVAFIPWLRDRGSLTARIQARGRFAVRVLRQGLGLPTADEARLLGIEPGVRAWVREVALLCDEQLRRLRAHRLAVSAARPTATLAGTPGQPLAWRAALLAPRLQAWQDQLQAAR
jgi:hypothetical protein